jgi:hypothetical protein
LILRAKESRSRPFVDAVLSDAWRWSVLTTGRYVRGAYTVVSSYCRCIRRVRLPVRISSSVSAISDCGMSADSSAHAVVYVFAATAEIALVYACVIRRRSETSEMVPSSSSQLDRCCDLWSTDRRLHSAVSVLIVTRRQRVIRWSSAASTFGRSPTSSTTCSRYDTIC